MSYEGTLNAIKTFLPTAIDALFAEYSEAAVSWDKEQVVAAIVAKAKLDSPNLRNTSEAFQFCERALAQLIASGKIQPRSYGYSSLGNEEMTGLLAKYFAPTPTKTTDEFSDILHDWNTLSHLELNEKKRDAAWMSRFNQAIAAGVL